MSLHFLRFLLADQAANALVLKMDALNHTPNTRGGSEETTVKEK